MRRFVLVLAILAVGLTGLLEYRRSLRPSSLAPLAFHMAPAEACRGLSTLERRGFGILFKDCLEYRTGLVVEEGEAALPTPGAPQDSLTVAVERVAGKVRITGSRRHRRRSSLSAAGCQWQSSSVWKMPSLVMACSSACRSSPLAELPCTPWQRRPSSPM